jgi:hypothetical protein
LLLVALLGVGCGDAVRALAPSAGDSAHRVGEMVGSLAARFGPIERTERFDELRPRLLRASLVPSLVYDDDEVWTAVNESDRTLVFKGTRGTSAYQIDVGDHAPEGAADYRGELILLGEGEGAFEWRLSELLGVGRVPLSGLKRSRDVLLRVPEQVGTGERSDALREALPRTAVALGRLIHLRSVQLSRHGKATAVLLVAQIEPDSLGPEYRRYARYLERYAPDTELNVRAHDALGLFWEMDLRRQRFVLRFAVQDGRLAPLQGAPRPLPDQLFVDTTFAMRSGRFRIGYTALRASVTLTSGPDHAGFVARFLQEPEWRLPPLAGPLLRAPLRQPFEAPGSMLAMRFEQGAAEDQTALLVRDYRLRVRENWLLRWLGGRVGSVVNTFRKEAEEESDRFNSEALLALRADLIEAATAAPSDATLRAATP